MSHASGTSGVNIAATKLGAVCKDADRAAISTSGSPSENSDAPVFWEDEAESSVADCAAVDRLYLEVSSPMSPPLSTAAVVNDSAGVKASSGERARRLSIGTHINGHLIEHDSEEAPPSSLTQLCGRQLGQGGRRLSTDVHVNGSLMPKAEEVKETPGALTPTERDVGSARRKPRPKRSDFLSCETYVNGRRPEQPEEALESFRPSPQLEHVSGNATQDGLKGTFADTAALTMAKLQAERPPVLADLSMGVHVDGAIVREGSEVADAWAEERLQLMSEKAAVAGAPCVPIWENDEDDP